MYIERSSTRGSRNTGHYTGTAAHHPVARCSAALFQLAFGFARLLSPLLAGGFAAASALSRHRAHAATASAGTCSSRPGGMGPSRPALPITSRTFRAVRPPPSTSSCWHARKKVIAYLPY